MAMFSRYVWILLSRGLVRPTLRFSRITRGPRTWHKTQCVRRTRSISTCEPPFSGSLFLGGDIWILEFEFLSTVQHPAATCATHFVVHGGGGYFPPCSVQSTIKSSICGCLRFLIIKRSLFFLVQCVGPVLRTSISRKSGIIRELI